MKWFNLPQKRTTNIDLPRLGLLGYAIPHIVKLLLQLERVPHDQLNLQLLTRTIFMIDHNHSESTSTTYGLISRTETIKPPLKEAVRPGENRGV